jgi:hypothetical protein
MLGFGIVSSVYSTACKLKRAGIDLRMITTCLGDSSYAELVERDPDDPPTSYKLTEARRECAGHGLEQLDDTAAALTACELEIGQPRPVPELRIRPKF